MTQRVTDEIPGAGTFTYDTDLLAAVLADYNKPALLELAKTRRVKGLHKLNKLELGIIVADTRTAARDAQRAKPTGAVLEQLHEDALELDARREIVRAHLGTPVGVVLGWDEIQSTYAAYVRRNLDAFDTDGAGGDQRPRCGIPMSRGGACDVLLNADGVCPDVNHRPAVPAAREQLTLGDVLIGPQTGDLYRFERWDGDKAVLVGQSGLTMRVQLEDVIDWERAPQASPARIEPYGPGMHVLGTITGRVPVVPLFIHTAGELHRPVADIQPDFTYNLSRLLDDPAHKPGAQLVDRDGLDSRVRDFVFATEGALGLFWDIVRDVTRQLNRARSVTVLILCRGGKHRSVTLGEELAEHFGVTAKHHHRHLPRVGR